MSEFKVGDKVITIQNSILHEGIIKNIRNNDSVCEVSLDGYNILLVTSIDNISRITKEKTTLENLEQRIEKLEKCVMGEQNPLEKRENVSTMSKNGLLTEDERVILRNLDKKWKWIARDLNCGNLYLYVEEPLKDDGFWKNKLEQKWCLIHMFNHLFQFIKWEDENAYNIEELLKGEMENEKK